MGWLKVGRISVAAALVTGLGIVGQVGTAAAAVSTSPPFTECPSIGYDPSCGILLEVNADNSVSVLVDPGVGPYDGGDDTLVGIVNESDAPVGAVTVDGPGTDLSGFDYDGLCDAYYNYGSPAGCPFGPTGYEGPTTSLRTDPGLPDDAEIDFNPVLQPGQTAYFSLEGALAYAHLTARKGGLAGTPVHYVGMGDSFSSGESNPPYQGPADSSIISQVHNYNSNSQNGCHRSDVAYPEDLSNWLAAENDQVDLQFIACTGAKTTQMLSGGSHHEIAQIDQLNQIEQYWGGQPDLVTWTAAGDDVNFAGVLYHCLWQYNLLLESCADDSKWRQKEDNTINAEETGLELNYAKLTAGLDSNTSVLISDYPQIFPGDGNLLFSTGQYCDKLAVLSPDDMDAFRDWTVELDNEIAQATAADGLNFVDVLADGSFDGHSICDSGGSAFNAVTDNNSSIGSRFNPFKASSNFQGSFHPNQAGQADYAQAFEDYITNATADGAPRTPAGLPANPAPDRGGTRFNAMMAPNTAATPALTAASAGGTTTGTTDTLGSDDLVISTPLGENDTCPQTYQGGQTLTVTGGGYAPRATVTVTLDPGASYALTQTATADANGQISLTLRLPLGLTGPAFDSGHLPIGYIEADGTGAQFTDQMDNVMFNIAPHGSNCGPIDTLPFTGFNPPVTNPNAINNVHAGSTVPVQFTLTGMPGTITDALWPGYPQSSPISCQTLAATGPAAPTTATADGSQSGSSDHYNYLWSTDPSWTGCRQLDLRLADGTDHTAYFNFGSPG